MGSGISVVLKCHPSDWLLVVREEERKQLYSKEMRGHLKQMIKINLINEGLNE